MKRYFKSVESSTQASFSHIMIIYRQSEEMGNGLTYPSFYYEVMNKENASFCDTLITMVFISLWPVLFCCCPSIVGDIKRRNHISSAENANP